MTTGLLYLLVTDLGYANTPDIVWEKLDVIDGDTELVNSDFLRAEEQASLSDSLLSGPTLSPEQLLAQSSQTDADYHLALHLSMQDQQDDGLAGTAIDQDAAQSALDDEEGQLIAAATEESLRSYHGIAAPETEPSTGSSQRPPPPDVEMHDASKSWTVVNVPPTPGGGTASGKTGTVVSLPPTGHVPPAAAGALDPTRVTVAVGIPLGSTVNVTVQHMNRHAGAAAAAPETAQPVSPPRNLLQEEQQRADELLAMQLQNEQEEASLHLARQLQAEEDGRGRATQQPPAAPSNVPRPSHQRQVQQRRPPPATSSSSSNRNNKDSSCTIS
jgi:hypothetical protein